MSCPVSPGSESWAPSAVGLQVAALGPGRGGGGHRQRLLGGLREDGAAATAAGDGAEAC